MDEMPTSFCVTLAANQVDVEHKLRPANFYSFVQPWFSFQIVFFLKKTEATCSCVLVDLIKVPSLWST